MSNYFRGNGSQVNSHAVAYSTRHPNAVFSLDGETVERSTLIKEMNTRFNTKFIICTDEDAGTFAVSTA